MDELSKRRRLETPSHSRNRDGGEAGPSRPRTRSRDRGGAAAGLSRSSTRSRSRLELNRNKELDADRERLERLERELHREQEILRYRERRSLRSKLRLTEHRESCERRDSPTPGHRASHARSRTPSFSTNDVVKIIKSIKHGFESQPVQQGTPLLNKNIDHKNILLNFDPAIKNQRILETRLDFDEYLPW